MSIKQPKNLKKGFTIIEVVLVLAIAGLIFLMVFVALPALQRNQRDTQRKQDYADLAAAIINSASSNGGKPIGSGSTTVVSPSSSSFVNKDGKDPQGRIYQISASDKPSSVSQISPITGNGNIDVFVYYKAQCVNGQPDAGGNKQFVIYAPLETGTYCNTFEY